MKILKRVALSVAFLLLVAGSVAYYYFRQATALPDWYAEEVALQEEAGAEFEFESESGEGPPTDAPVQWETVEVLEADDPPGAGKPKKVLRGFHHRSRRSTRGKRAVRASRATFDDGRLEAGVILDLSKIPKDDLSERDRGLYERATSGFPGITKRDVYVGIEDHPLADGEMLQLGPNPKIRVGRLRYSLPDAAAKLGMSPTQLRSEFNRELRRMKITRPSR